jgi:hypothetical protein
MEINESQNNGVLKDSFTARKTQQCDGSMPENFNANKIFTTKKLLRALSMLYLANKHFWS